MNNLDPALDGISHVNLALRAATEVGRLASNLARTPFDHPEHGRFASITGLWYWLTIPSNRLGRDQLRITAGLKVKRTGRHLGGIDIPKSIPDHKHQVTLGLDAKANAHPHIEDELRRLNLPIAHYSVFHDRIRHHDYDWTLTWWAERCNLPVITGSNTPANP